MGGVLKLPAGVSAVLGASLIPFGVGAGIAIGMTTYAGVRMWRKYRQTVDSPYQYLNRIHKAGATLVTPTSVKIELPKTARSRKA
jgi:hypothetical protein